jgi:hypothetical protein
MGIPIMTGNDGERRDEAIPIYKDGGPEEENCDQQWVNERAKNRTHSFFFGTDHRVTPIG